MFSRLIKSTKLIAASFLLLHAQLYAGEMVIGIHGFDDEHINIKDWDKFSQFLSEQTGYHDVKFKVFDHDSLQQNLEQFKVDFLITDPVEFIKLREKNSLVRVVASIEKKFKSKVIPALAGTIITLSANREIKTISDLRGKRIGYFEGHHVDSYLSQAKILQEKGIELGNDIKEKIFEEGDYRSLFTALAESRIDAVFVKAGTIEHIEEGLLPVYAGLEPEELNILNQQQLPGYPFKISTRLFPNHVLVMMPSVSPEYVKALASTLLSIRKGEKIIEQLEIHQFTVPHDYSSITEAASDVGIPPFHLRSSLTVRDIWQHYKLQVIFVLLGLLIFTGLLVALLIINRKVNAEKKVSAESSRRFDLAMRASSDGLWEWKVKTNTVYLSPRWKAMLGYGEQELVNDFSTWEAITHEDDKNITMQMIQDCMEGKRDGFIAEFRMKHKDGHWAYILSRAIVERNEEGEVERFVGTHLDITEQRVKENDIQREKEQQIILRELLENVVLVGGSIEERLQRSLEKLLNISFFKGDAAGEIFIVGEDQSLKLVASENINKDLLPSCEMARKNGCDCEYSARSGESIFSNVEQPSLHGCNTYDSQSHLSLPLVTGKSVLGVLSIHLPNDMELTNELEQFLSSVTDILAVFVNKSNQEKAISQYSEQLEDLVNKRTDELNQSKYQLESIIENLPAIFYMKDTDGVYQMVNREFEDALETSKDKLIGFKDRNIFTAEKINEIQETDNKVFDSAEAITFEETITDVDEHSREYLTRKIPLLDDNGNVASLIGISTDISDIKSLQHALSLTMDGLKRRAGLENLVSTLIRNLISVPLSRLESMIDSTLGQVGAFLNIERAHMLGFRDDATCGIRHQWVSEGVPSTIGILKDIPVKEESVFYKDLEEGRVIIINDINDYEDESGMLTSLSQPGSVRSCIYFPIIFNGVLNSAMVLEKVTSTYKWNSDDLELLKTLSDLIGQVISNNRAQLDLISAKDEAERLARVKSEFLANMSHEIRTPLNAVLGIAKIGERDSGETQDKQNFKRILDSGKHLYGLVNDILDFSRFEAGKFNVEEVEYSPGSVIDNAVNFIAARALEKKVDFQVEENNLPESLTGDPLRITQILTNLLGNALKFTDEGFIRLAMSTKDDQLELSVSDTGLGMSDEQISRLFNPFEQADNSTTRKFGGSGLGLTIVKRLVEAMQGDISVNSEVNSGSTFTITLPMVNPVFKETDKEAALPAIRLVTSDKKETKRLFSMLTELSESIEVLPAKDAFSDDFSGNFIIDENTLDNELIQDKVSAVDTTKNKVILLVRPDLEGHHSYSCEDKLIRIECPLRIRHLREVILGESIISSAQRRQRLHGVKVFAAEDNELNRVVLEDLLKAEGASVKFAENGKLAVEAIKSGDDGDFDVILMDIQMPVMDGYEATQKILELKRDIPVIGLTAHAFAEEKQKCFDMGMVEHVSKPVDVDTIVTAIKKHLNRNITELTVVANQQSHEHETEAQSNIKEKVPNDNVIDFIDWEGLNSRYSNRNDFIKKILTVSLDGFDKNREKLEKAISENDMSELAFVTHAIKGSSGNIFATTVHQLAKDAEQEARSESDKAVDMSKELLHDLEGLIGYISEHLDTVTA